MSRFSDLHREFKEEVSVMKDGILFAQSSYKAVGLLREASAQTTDPWPPNAISAINSLASPNRKAENLTYDGTVVLLAATYEAFARDTIKAICGEIEIRIPKFDELAEKIKSANARATGRILSRHSEERYSQFDYLDLSKKIGTCVVGSTQYLLNSGPLSSHDRNLSSTELADLFRRIGIDKLWEKIGATGVVQQYFQTTAPVPAQKAATAKLDEFISLRNQVAHNGSGDSSIGPEALVQWLDFFLTLTESLASIAAEYCNGLSPIVPNPVTAIPAPAPMPSGTATSSG